MQHMGWETGIFNPHTCRQTADCLKCPWKGLKLQPIMGVHSSMMTFQLVTFQHDAIFITAFVKKMDTGSVYCSWYKNKRFFFFLSSSVLILDQLSEWAISQMAVLIDLHFHCMLSLTFVTKIVRLEKSVPLIHCTVSIGTKMEGGIWHKMCLCNEQR